MTLFDIFMNALPNETHGLTMTLHIKQFFIEHIGLLKYLNTNNKCRFSQLTSGVGVRFTVIFEKKELVICKTKDFHTNVIRNTAGACPMPDGHPVSCLPQQGVTRVLKIHFFLMFFRSEMVYNDVLGSYMCLSTQKTPRSTVCRKFSPNECPLKKIH